MGAADLLLELDDPVDERLGGRGAARHVHVHRHDAVAAADHRVAVVVVAAAVGAGTHGDHPARLRHLVVHLAQGRGHLVAERAGHDHQIGLPWAGAEHLGAEAADVVARRGGMHHLDGAAGQTEGHGPQRSGLGPVHHGVIARGDEAFLHHAFNHRVVPCEAPSFPIQGTLFPLVGEAHDQDGQEDDDGDETGHPDLVQRDRPREEECDFQIEKNEEDGDEVVAHVELHARIFESLEATLVGGILGRVGPVRAQHVAQDQGHHPHSDADQDEQKNGEVLIEVHLEGYSPLGPHPIPAMRNGRAGLLVCWCRRRDSNSHSFRHYPLKIACLPISPRRLMSASGWHEEPEGLFGFPDNPGFYSGKTRLSMNRLLFQQLFCRDLCCARSRCRGRYGGRRSGRRGRRRHGLHGGRSGCRGLQHAADPGGADVAEIGQRERGRKEHAGQHRRRARQEVRAAAGAEQAARAAAAERGPHVGTLAVLDEHEADHCQRGQHLHGQDHIHEHIHFFSTPVGSRGAVQAAAAMICKKSWALSDAPPTRPPSMSGWASKAAAFAAFMLPP